MTNSDLFQHADFSAVMNGDKTSAMRWNCNANQFCYRNIYDEKNQPYLVIDGTGFVVSIRGETIMTREFGIWRDGLMGEFIAAANSISEALQTVRKLFPPHIILRLQQEAGYYSGRRKSV